MTHTVAELALTPAAFNEIQTKLRMAGYHHVFHDGLIDMTGIGLVENKDEKPWPMPSPLIMRTRSG